MSHPTSFDHAKTDILFGRLNALEHAVEQLWTFRLAEVGGTPDQARDLGAAIARRAVNIGIGYVEPVPSERIYAQVENMTHHIEAMFERIAVDLEQRAAGVAFPDD